MQGVKNNGEWYVSVYDKVAVHNGIGIPKPDIKMIPKQRLSAEHKRKTNARLTAFVARRKAFWAWRI